VVCGKAAICFEKRMKFLRKEIENFGYGIEYEVEKLSETEAKILRAKFETEKICLEKATKNYIKTIIGTFAIVAYSSLWGIRSALATAIILIAIPYFISSSDVGNRGFGTIEKMKMKIVERTIFSNAFWVVGIGYIIANVFLHLKN